MNATSVQTQSDNSRVWIYQSNRLFTDSEVIKLNEILTEFNLSWAAHGKKLNSSFEVVDNLFIILAVDEEGQNATGCSIDSSVSVIKQINELLKVDLLDRLNIAYIENNEVQICKMFDFQEKIKSGIITPNTIVFNNLITNYGEFKKNWKTEAKNSWHSDLFI